MWGPLHGSRVPRPRLHLKTPIFENSFASTLFLKYVSNFTLFLKEILFFFLKKNTNDLMQSSLKAK